MEAVVDDCVATAARDGLDAGQARIKEHLGRWFGQAGAPFQLRALMTSKLQSDIYYAVGDIAKWRSSLGETAGHRYEFEAALHDGNFETIARLAAAPPTHWVIASDCAKKRLLAYTAAVRAGQPEDYISARFQESLEALKSCGRREREAAEILTGAAPASTLMELGLEREFKSILIAAVCMKQKSARDLLAPLARKLNAKPIPPQQFLQECLAFDNAKPNN
jgi:hypothetical protein